MVAPKSCIRKIRFMRRNYSATILNYNHNKYLKNGQQAAKHNNRGAAQSVAAKKATQKPQPETAQKIPDNLSLGFVQAPDPAPEPATGNAEANARNAINSLNEYDKIFKSSKLKLRQNPATSDPADAYDLIEPPLTKQPDPNRGGQQNENDSAGVNKRYGTDLGTLSATAEAGAQQNRKAGQKPVASRDNNKDRADAERFLAAKELYNNGELDTYQRPNYNTLAEAVQFMDDKNKPVDQLARDNIPAAQQASTEKSPEYLRVEKAYREASTEFEKSLKTDKEKSMFRTVMNDDIFRYLTDGSIGFATQKLAERLIKMDPKLNNAKAIGIAGNFIDGTRNSAMTILRKQTFVKPVDLSFYYNKGPDGISLYEQEVEKGAQLIFKNRQPLSQMTMQQARDKSRFQVDYLITKGAENRRQLNQDALANLLNTAQGKKDYITEVPWQTVLEGVKLLVELSPAGPAIDIVENLMIAVEAHKNGDDKAMYKAIAAAGFSTLEFIPVVRLLSKGGKLAMAAMKGLPVVKKGITAVKKGMPLVKKAQKVLKASGLTGPIVTKMVFNQNSKIAGIFLKDIAKGAVVSKAFGKAILAEYLTATTKVAYKKLLLGRNFTPQMLKDLYGSKPFFLEEVKTKFPQVFEGMSDESIKQAYEAGIDMAFDKLKGEEQERVTN